MANQELTVVAKILAKDGKSELVKNELKKLIDPTRKEKGCICYDLHEDNDNPNLFIFYEKWESLELLQDHLGSTHIAEMQKATDGAIESLDIYKMTQIG